MKEELDNRHKAIKFVLQESSPGVAATVADLLCSDPECMVCGRIFCPHGDPLHYHHDGCPACNAGESSEKNHPPFGDDDFDPFTKSEEQP